MRDSLAPYVHSDGLVIKKMLERSGASKEDIVYDLGSGVGHIVAGALLKPYEVKRAVGIEINKKRAEHSIKNLQRFEKKYPPIQGRWKIINDDVFNCDISEADIVTTYLTTRGNELLKSKLKKDLSKDAIVVTNSFIIPGWEPYDTDLVIAPHAFTGYGTNIYIYKMSELKEEQI